MRYQRRQGIVDTAVDAGAVARQGNLGTPCTLIRERELTGGTTDDMPGYPEEGRALDEECSLL